MANLSWDHLLTVADIYAEQRDRDKRPRNALRSYGRNFEPLELREQYRRKRRHASSSDSSLLEPAITPRPTKKPGAEQHGSRNHLLAEPKVDQSRKRKAESSDNDSSTSRSVRQETFEKRKRHKTREDRYEAKKEKENLEEKDGKKRPRMKRAKKGDEKRAARKAGEDLMNNFTSESIGQERLTVSINIATCRRLCSQPLDTAFSWAGTFQKWSRIFSGKAPWL